MPRFLARCAALAALCSSAPAQDNVLLIVLDDVGVDYVGCYGEAAHPANTPNIDALADQGVLFRNFWTAPVCSATRAQVQTGRFGYRTGVGHVVTKNHGLPKQELVLPEVFERRDDLGHTTAAFGKWHLGNAALGGVYAPNLAGYRHFEGTRANLNQPQDYYSWEHIANGVVTQSEDYATTRTVDDFLGWHGQVSGPWFAYVAFHAAHQPFHRPPDHLHTLDLPDGDPRHDPVPFYRATIESVDTEIGRLLAGLGEELEETHVVLLGDNGTPGQVSLAPFLPSHAKQTPYEGGLNVPLIVSGPAVHDTGSAIVA